MEKVDVIIIGAGAAGLMCAIEAGKRQRKVIVLDHANKAGKKILMSGGGRCNFTNLHIHPDRFISHNKHFCKSALSRYTQWDFIDLVKRYHIAHHEKTQGQLFCDDKAKEILDMLLAECASAQVKIQLNTSINLIEKKSDQSYIIKSSQGNFQCQSVVIATGGLSIPTMGASPFGYKVAEQFGIKVWPTRAGLVPLTLHENDKNRYSILSGVAVDAEVTTFKKTFHDSLLFTHRGISGPAILQISSYWQAGEELQINLLPNNNLFEKFKSLQKTRALLQTKTILNELLPQRLVEVFLPTDLAQKKLADIAHRDFISIDKLFSSWHLTHLCPPAKKTQIKTIG